MSDLIGVDSSGLSFQGKRVFLTGGSRGIGQTIKNHFLKLGAEVEAPGRECLDLASRESIQRYFEQRQDVDVDIFLHCAGENILGGINEITDEALDRCFQVNYFSAVELLRMITPRMAEKGNGKIVFISSLYAIVSKERRIAYSSSKNALNGLVKTLALELAKSKVMINAVAPGYVMTDMTRKNLTAAELESITANIPLGRLQEESDISNIVIFLCSEYNQNITGQLIAVDGGFLCR